jgi:hypothetical protein
MTDRPTIAKALDAKAQQAQSLAEGQALAAEADRLRRLSSPERRTLSLFYPRN